MIIAMARVRIAGPSALADATLRLLQDIGDLHPMAAPQAVGRAPRGRLTRQALRLLERVDQTLARLPPLTTSTAAAAPMATDATFDWPAAARRLRGWHRDSAALRRQRTAAQEAEAVLLRYQAYLAAFQPLLERARPDGGVRASFVLLRPGASAADLEQALRRTAGPRIEWHARALPSGETAVLLLADRQASAALDRGLAGTPLDELPAPPGLEGHDLAETLPALQARLTALRHQMADIDARLQAMGRQAGAALTALKARLHDLLALAEARERMRSSALLFVIEGWMPAAGVPALRARLARELGAELVVDLVATEPWTRRDAPVALANPRLFRSFELITRAFPLPRYGSIDPTPFVAVFFPMFFGLMLGDIGYGLVLGLVAAVLRWHPRSSAMGRAVAEMALGCALFTLIFGVMFGEFFGDLGARWGLEPLAFDREHALAPFLWFAVALGAVHIVLGLVLAAIGAWREGHRRRALGRGVTILMLGLSALALLAAFQVLPARLFTPAAIALLVAFPVLVALEGVIAVIELMSTFGHILSYARIMALGTASLMLAVIANRMAGALGSVLVGVAFALLFHLVNFAIGLFSPTIHALRLHYVEFFGEFYSPGGTAYRPLRHWQAAPPPAANA